MEQDDGLNKVYAGIKNLTLVIFALQMTLVGLLDGGSFELVVFALVLGLAGAIQVFQPE